MRRDCRDSKRGPLNSDGEARRDIPIPVDHNRRIGQLRRRITRTGLHGLLITHLPDVRYLCGFTGSSAALAVTRRAARLFTDGRYTAQAAEEVQGAKVEIVAASVQWRLQWLAAQPGIDSAGVGSCCRTTVADLGATAGRAACQIAAQLSDAACGPLVEPLRLIKDEDELAMMSEAALLAASFLSTCWDFCGRG